MVPSIPTSIVIHLPESSRGNALYPQNETVLEQLITFPLRATNQVLRYACTPP